MGCCFLMGSEFQFGNMKKLQTLVGQYVNVHNPVEWHTYDDGMYYVMYILPQLKT